MNKRLLLSAGLLVAFLAGLAVAWPLLTAGVSRPHAGTDWYPKLDPGTLLFVDLPQQREEVALGEDEA